MPVSTTREPGVVLPTMSAGEEVVNDYRFLELTLRAHPASFLRADLARLEIIRNEELRARSSGARVRISGLVTIRQRPGTAQGVIFMTIEDETSVANIIVWPHTFERFRPIILGARYIAVSGELQQESGVLHVVAARLDDLTPLLARLTADVPPIEALARADAVKHPHPREHRQSCARPPQSTAPRRAGGAPGAVGERSRRAGTRLGPRAFAPRRQQGGRSVGRKSASGTTARRRRVRH